MVNNLLFYIIISIVIISLLHYLYSYFINILTIPKIKDLVNKPREEYKNIEKIILKNNDSNIININNTSSNSNNDDTTEINNLNIVSNETKTEMKNELKSFFNELNNNNMTNNNLTNNNLTYSNY
jgi:hypothetical protein